MSILRKNKQRVQRRILRVRKQFKKNLTLPRVSVFRSLKHVYVQLIDDAKQKTLASSSSMVLKDVAGDKKAVARAVGLALAQKAKELGVAEAVFDRGGCLYHGRVKALAEGLREGGMRI